MQRRRDLQPPAHSLPTSISLPTSTAIAQPAATKSQPAAPVPQPTLSDLSQHPTTSIASTACFSWATITQSTPTISFPISTHPKPTTLPTSAKPQPTSSCSFFTAPAGATLSLSTNVVSTSQPQPPVPIPPHPLFAQPPSVISKPTSEPHPKPKPPSNSPLETELPVSITSTSILTKDSATQPVATSESHSNIIFIPKSCTAQPTSASETPPNA
ncbi:MAG: hypothetical protein WDW36_007928 [Sanguina aurantia]